MRQISTMVLLVLLQLAFSCNDSPATTKVSSAPTDNLQIEREIDTVKNLVIQSFQILHRARCSFLLQYAALASDTNVNIQPPYYF
jgi:hypothetical protein